MSQALAVRLECNILSTQNENTARRQSFKKDRLEDVSATYLHKQMLMIIETASTISSMTTQTIIPAMAPVPTVATLCHR